MPGSHWPRDHFSVSQLNSYLLCPRKYRFRYVDERPPERRSVNLALGSAVHSAIEWWQTQRIEGEPTEGPDVLRIFRADLTAGTVLAPLDYEDKEPAEVRSLGEALVGLFVERFGSEEPPSAVEERVEVPLRHPVTGAVHELPLLGFVDFVSATGTIGEIKTTSRKNRLSQWELQLSAYAYAFGELRGTSPRLQVVQLIKTKTPALEVGEINVDERAITWFLDVAFGALEGIERGAFHPIPSWMCRRCEYRRACRG